MMRKIKQILKDKELRNKVLFVSFMLIIFRFAAHIPIPIVDTDRLNALFRGNQVLGMMNILTGSGMENFSIVMLGVGPYITASIIMQLLTMISPKMKEIYHESGEDGRRKFNQLTRMFTVPLALLSGFGMITLLRNEGVVLSTVGNVEIFFTLVTITAGTVFMMWLGELISEKNIGNGISLIIFAGIVSGLPMTMYQTSESGLPLPTIIGLAAMAIFVVIGVVLITEAQRNIPVSYARRTSGAKVTQGGGSTFLPLRVNSSGMVPIIFAMSIMLFPGIIASFFVNNANAQVAGAATYVQNIFANQEFYAVLYFIMVFLFTYFYTAIVFDAQSVAENLQKHGGFVPGIRPGRNTAEYLEMVINRITFVGAIFLAFMAVLPIIGQNITHVNTFAIGGSSVLIVVGVVLDTIRQIDSQLTMRDYEEI
ncbi:MAG: preprotein translocase subunit SecY [Candidatus Paceibacterota bacterium]